MSTKMEIIKSTIRKIQEQQLYPAVEINEKLRLIEDLGFKSLDIAQLVAMLEIELGVDPFTQGAGLEEIKTINDLYRIYEKYSQN